MVGPANTILSITRTPTSPASTTTSTSAFWAGSRRIKSDFAFHRWQHIYLWVLYGFVTIKWQLYDDFRDLINGRFGGRQHPRPQGRDLAIFVGGKMLFFCTCNRAPIAGAFCVDGSGVLHGRLICSGSGDELGVSTAALCGKRGISTARPRHRPTTDALGRASSSDNGQLCSR